MEKTHRESERVEVGGKNREGEEKPREGTKLLSKNPFHRLCSWIFAMSDLLKKQNEWVKVKL